MPLLFQTPRMLLDEESSPSVMSTTTTSSDSSNSSFGDHPEKKKIWIKKKVKLDPDAVLFTNSDRARLKPSCHIRFLHAFSAVRCVFEVITFFP